MFRTRFANLLIDSVDLLTDARALGDTWPGVVKVAHKIGAKAVNAGALLEGTNNVAWMRSSMEMSWLVEYEDAGLYTVDPILHAALARRRTKLYSVEKARRSHIGDPQSAQLHDSLISYRYRYFMSQNWRDNGVEKCVVLSTEDDPTHLFGAGTARAFSVVSALLSQNLDPPGEHPTQGWVWGFPYDSLSSREKDVLSYMGLGMSTQQIADHMILQDAQVRHLLDRACKAMGTHQQEQALALAMTRGLVSL
ncbi:helix-turn-helix transcriptional regulator [Qingshengfaniella alkalisoli]|uniref:HTH luxR-type domain-containing protein n=1 Tax=Qingshengfaniella alkalisoli TaxID=2599296 RepID=A0A5B8JAK6_9RHOB|nr:LuxR C-terminal-related transcriptional regulator [Qingshengfaniella alkalisoli]QDY71327.1 hypothetical protein FPZ52_16615 [Qingshengfaniella alkalisoli]